MNGTENPHNSGTHATRERCNRLAVLRLPTWPRPAVLWLPTQPLPRRWLSSGIIVIYWDER